MSTTVGDTERLGERTARAERQATATPPSNLHIPASPAAERAVLGAILPTPTASSASSRSSRPTTSTPTPTGPSSRRSPRSPPDSRRHRPDHRRSTARARRHARRRRAASPTWPGSPTSSPIRPTSSTTRGSCASAPSSASSSSISQQLMASCAREEGDAMDALDAAESADPRDRRPGACAAASKRVGELARDEVEHIQRVSSHRRRSPGVETGFYRLDELTSGLQKQDLIILAARPGRRQDRHGAQHRRPLRRCAHPQGRGLLPRDVRPWRWCGVCSPPRRVSTSAASRAAC